MMVMGTLMTGMGGWFYAHAATANQLFNETEDCNSTNDGDVWRLVKKSKKMVL